MAYVPSVSTNNGMGCISTNGNNECIFGEDGIVLSGNLLTTPVVATISQSGIITTNPTGFNILSDLNMNSHNIRNVDTITTNYSPDTPIYLDYGNGGGFTISSAQGSTTIVSNNNGVLDINSTGSISSTATSASNTITGSNVGIYSTTGGVEISAVADSVNIITPQTTWFNLTTELTGDGSITLTNVNSVADLTLQTGGTGVLSINAGDNIQTTCGENYFIQTNGTTGIIFLNTGDLSNGGGINWNSYFMGINFFNLWNGGFNYPITGGTNNWEVVRSTSITFPTQFLHNRWAVQFSGNYFSVGSSPSDKGLAIYYDFLDSNGNTYGGNNYNQTTPYANWFNSSTYTATSQTPMSISFLDYYDFTGAVNPLDLRLWWYGDQAQNQNFQISVQFTLMNLI